MGYFTEVFWPGIWGYFVHTIIPILKDIAITAYQDKTIFWAILPLIINLFLIQIYFGRNKEESIGWNTAYANCIVLIFVGTELLRYMYATYSLDELMVLDSIAFVKGIFVLIIVLMALILAFINFFHSVSKKFAFFISNSLFIIFVAFFSIIMVHSEVTLNGDTSAAGIILFLIFYTFFKIIKMVTPASEHAEEILEKRRERREHEHDEAKKEFKHKVRDFKNNIKSKFLKKEKNVVQAIKEHLESK